MKMILNDGTFYEVSEMNEEIIKLSNLEGSNVRRVISVTIVNEKTDVEYLQSVLTDENLKEVVFQGDGGSIKKENLTMDSITDRLSDEGRVVVARLKYLI